MSEVLQTRYALLLEYEGTHYGGFQIQKNARTVQGEIEKALGILLRRPIRITFAGRTDSGVHASGQVISLHLEDGQTERETSFKKNPSLLARSLNGLIDNDISVRAISQVKAGFHPRYSCIARKYEYLIWNHPLRSSLWRHRALWLRQKIDIRLMNRELKSIIGLHDFSAFTPQARAYKDSRRHVYSATFLKDGDGDGNESESEAQKSYCDEGLVRFPNLRQCLFT